MSKNLQLLRPSVAAAFIAFALAACGGNVDEAALGQVSVPAAPATPSFVDSAAAPAGVAAFVDNIATNQRGDARYSTLATNAGVRLVAPYLDYWKPLTEIVDAGVSAPAVGSFPAVVPSTATGVPTDGSPNGTILNASVLGANIQYVVTTTTNRTSAQADAAYYDDRRGKGYSVTDGMGPLTASWCTAAQQTTTITSIPADATSVAYNDSGNNTGVGSTSNGTFGKVVDLINTLGNNASTEPAKRFYKYPRPFRWSSNVVVVPTLVPAESTTPATDGGFISGHTAEAVRDAVGMAYVVPERFQEMLSRGLELGENRIVAGMHSPLDVIGGRMLGIAAAAANLYDPANATLKSDAYTQAHTALMSLTGTSATTFNAFAHSGDTSNDRFADYTTNRTNFLRRMTLSFSQIGATNAAPIVPKGAEVLLETRFPYLDANQRRVVLKTTEMSSGYPLMDDAEGWGRLNLFAAADGYGAFNGSVTIAMDASKGGFNAADTWRNAISGTGKLTLQGSGTLTLAGTNTYSGGTEVQGGTVRSASANAFGSGDVYLGSGTVAIGSTQAVVIAGKYTQLQNTTLELNVGPNGQGVLHIGGQTTLAGGTLHVKFAGGYTPKSGDLLNLISTGALSGRFANIVVDGFTATPTYDATGVHVHLKS
ncbi:phosphatase PAP2 family protein [Paraburkholderia panacisoli]|uniref:Phosphatase PAP2 family protein n=1 Tax=Paraburkholderia panacisoli TaxID=2603818 RepID=A0A5B0G263_9BURK|nr:phosphatase PAP2 family protein [Paraburkholderia panacisoli]KAA0997496.1 phosphatase PAP2 family protein [Paraburkholderia panacisoli]